MCSLVDSVDTFHCVGSRERVKEKEIERERAMKTDDQMQNVSNVYPQNAHDILIGHEVVSHCYGLRARVVCVCVWFCIRVCVGSSRKVCNAFS